MTLDIKIHKQPEDVSDAQNGDRLLGTIEVFGASHHLELIRVDEDEEGAQQAANEEYDRMYDDLQQLYPCQKFETFAVPGFEGRYIAFMHPYED